MTTTDEPQKHVKMPDEPLEIDEEDFYVRAFIKWAIEEQPKVKRLEAENAELREELAKWERLTASINLPDYPVSQFVPKDLERENAKLRELVCKVEHYEQYGCYECPHSNSCDIDTFFDDCIMSHEIEREKRELGIEVDS